MTSNCGDSTPPLCASLSIAAKLGKSRALPPITKKLRAAKNRMNIARRQPARMSVGPRNTLRIRLGLTSPPADSETDMSKSDGLELISSSEVINEQEGPFVS